MLALHVDSRLEAALGTIFGPARESDALRSRAIAARLELAISSRRRARSSATRARCRPRRLQVVATATLHTNHGAIELELFPHEAPKTVDNFTRLASDGFYDGVVFHRVIPDFMIQGGDPTGTGSGGPGYTFADEQNERKVERGAVAMANSGPNTNGSQFFIVTAEACPWLDGKHTVFGRVRGGMDVVDAISHVETDARDRPRDDVTIQRVELGAA